MLRVRLPLVLLVLNVWSAQAADVAPTIASISSSQTVNEGEAITLAVSVNGTTPFAYQWRKDGDVISSATTNQLTLDPIRVADAGSYTLRIENAVGAVTAGPILLAVNPATPPSFYSSSDTVNVTLGHAFTLYSSSSGSGPMTYSWTKDGVAIPGATASSYSKQVALATDAGVYRVTATNIAGTATSGPITLTLSPPTPPSFLSVPSSLTGYPGEYLSFSFSVNGTEPMTFELLREGLVVETSSWTHFTRSNLQPSDTGTYTIRATNPAGTATSGPFTVTVLPARPPEVSTSASNRSVLMGGDLSLQHSIWYGTEPLTYQWQKDGIDIPGATKAQLMLVGVDTSDAGNYQLLVSNVAGSARSGITNVAVRLPRSPHISMHPRSAAYRLGDYVTLSVEAAGENLTYQWSKDGVPIAGATRSNYTVSSSFGSSSTGSYVATVSNALGTVTSQPAVLTVLPNSAPVIRRHPRSQVRLPGETAYLQVDVAAHPAATYQWKKDGVPITNATSSSLTLQQLAASDGGSYTVTVSNTLGSVTSAVAEVEITPLTPPVITQHPTSTSVLPGQSFSLQVGVRSTHGVTYEWRKDGVVLADRTSNSFYIWSAGPADAGSYTVTVTNAAGSVTSEEAEIRVDTNNTRPLITGTSGSRSVWNGQWVTFNITVAESGTTAQWRLDGEPIPNATSTSLSLTASPAAVGSYTVTVTSGSRTETSRPMRLTLLEDDAPPRISQHPRSLSVETGDTASFEVEVASVNPTTYQWRKNDVNIPLAQQSWLSISNVDAEDVGTYSVVVTNAAGSTTSQGAVLSLAPTTAPTIQYQPQSLVLHPDYYSATLSVEVLGSHPLTYQWYRNGQAITGATSGSHSLARVPESAGNYYVVVTNSAGEATSLPAVVTYGERSEGPQITTNPVSQTGYIGAPLTLRAQASGGTGLSYQWKRNGVDIAGATESTLTVSALRPGDAGYYTVWITDAYGVMVSRPATVEVKLPVAPVITLQPKDAAVRLGFNLHLSAAASGTPAPRFQWYRDGTEIPGATSSSLSLYNFTAGLAGRYELVATNAAGSTRSRVALVSVHGAHTGFYIGQFASGGSPEGEWVLQVTGQAGRFVGILPGRSLAIVRNVTVAADGSFVLDESDEAETDMEATRDRYFAGTLTGQIALNGSVQGTVPDLALTLNGSRMNGHSATSSWGGEYESVLLYSAAGRTHALAGPDGRAIVVLVQADTVLGGIGTLSGNGQLDIPIGPDHLTGQLNSDGRTMKGQIQLAAGRTLNFAAPAVPGGPERLLNLSIRAPAGSGDRTLIVGFVVDGLLEKSVLVRGAGPALSEFNVAGVLADPRLKLYVKDTVISENDNWQDGNLGPAVALASQEAGAFAFKPGSLDAALLQDLAPGHYTAHVAGPEGATGVSLVEIYEDGSELGAPRLLNLSARTEVGQGDAIMIVGLIVGGDAPKRFLIRGIGPTLEEFKVAGALANPYLRLFRDKTLVRENDDWSAGPDAGDIAAASGPVGAFALPVDSKDAALLVYLEPGHYSAHVGGVGNTTGVALIEVYEVP